VACVCHSRHCTTHACAVPQGISDQLSSTAVLPTHRGIDTSISDGTIKDEYYHLAASDDSHDNGLIYGYQSPIRYCHRIAPRHCPVGSLPTSHGHPHPRALHVDPAKALPPEPRSRHVGVPQYLFRHLARLLACLPHLPL
jgi:hypothetical protein